MSLGGNGRAARTGCGAPAEVVLADLADADFANPRDRVAASPEGVPLLVGDGPYAPPELHLGRQDFGAEVDIWALGCVAGETLIGSRLFPPTLASVEGARTGQIAKSFLAAHFALLGAPQTEAVRAWMEALPYTQRLYGTRGLPRTRPVAWPPKPLNLVPERVAAFLQDTLQLDPRARPPAASALRHRALQPATLTPVVAMAKGKVGTGTIVSGFMDESVLEYLQNDPVWPELVGECVATCWGKRAHSISKAEGAKSMKRELVGYIDEDRPPACLYLNSDKNIQCIQPRRVCQFAKALRRVNKAWLQKLTAHIRVEIRKHGLPEEYLETNGTVFEEEDMADNALVYASVQLMRVAAREDGWHTDGGCSLLHISATVFGSRSVSVALEPEGCISMAQRPGSIYLGNLCALNHNVVHHERSPGCYGEGGPGEPIQIAVMLRSDVFRAARARKLNATPGPRELFRLVNGATAKHLAEEVFQLPTLADVLSES